MKKFLILLFGVLFLFSSCSSGEEVILDEEYFEFSFGFLGSPERSSGTSNSLELLASYSSNQVGNILENNQVFIENNVCEIDLINPQSFQYAQEVKIKVICEKPFKTPQVNGTLNIEYLEGSTQRISQGNFLITIDQ